MYGARGAEDIRTIAYSDILDISDIRTIAIEFFLRLKIHNLGTCAPIFHIKNIVFIVSKFNYETLAMQCHAEIFILCATQPM